MEVKFLQLPSNAYVRSIAVAERSNQAFSIVERIPDSDYNNSVMRW
jgi:hypothetical protein